MSDRGSAEVARHRGRQLRQRLPRLAAGNGRRFTENAFLWKPTLPIRDIHENP